MSRRRPQIRYRSIEPFEDAQHRHRGLDDPRMLRGDFYHRDVEVAGRGQLVFGALLDLAF